jgi:hypothetical protein
MRRARIPLREGGVHTICLARIARTESRSLSVVDRISPQSIDRGVRQWKFLNVPLGALIALAKGIQLFDSHSRRRFGHRFFTLRAFWLAALGINLMWLGHYCYANAVRDHASINEGLVLFVLSIVAIVWMAYENICETDLAHGLAGSALQLALFFPVALYSLPLLLIAMAIVLFASFKAGPAWLVHR